MIIYYDYCPSPLGEIKMLSDGESLLGIIPKGSDSPICKIAKNAEFFDRIEVLVLTKAWLFDYFAKKRSTPLDIKFSLEASEFRKEIYSQISKIPYGEVNTHRDIAERTAFSLVRSVPPVSTVMAAIKSNPFPIIIPSHRVVNDCGGLSCGRDGEIQSFLLRHEYSCNFGRYYAG